MIANQVKSKQRAASSISEAVCPACKAPLNEAFVKSLVDTELAQAKSYLVAEISQQVRADSAEKLAAVKAELTSTKSQLRKSHELEKQVREKKLELQELLDNQELAIARCRDEIREEERAKAKKRADGEVDSRVKAVVREREDEIVGLKKVIRERDSHIERLKRGAQSLGETAAAGPRRALEGIAFQELFLNELQARFPDDYIEVVPAGTKGADLLQTVVDRGRRCGKIIWEVSDSKVFRKERLSKLRKDMAYHKADLGVVVARILPARAQGSTVVDGVPVCDFLHATHVCWPLREVVIANSRVALQNSRQSGAKALYDFHATGQFSVLLLEIMELVSEVQDDTERLRTFLTGWAERQRQRFDKVIVDALRLLDPITTHVSELAPLQHELEQRVHKALPPARGTRRRGTPRAKS